MTRIKKSDLKKIETIECNNKNCWLVKNLNYNPYERCRYCELKFKNCLFLQYQIISLILIVFVAILFFLLRAKMLELVIISIFTLIIVYGYFFNKSADKIIKAHFIQGKTKRALKKLNIELDERVKKRTRELEKAYGKLKKLDNAKSSFIAITSHQLRTPLTATKCYVSMILENDYGEVPKNIRGPLKNVYESNERLINLVNNILNISKINAGKMELNLEKISLTNLIKNIIIELENEAKKKNITLIFKKPLKKEDQVLADKEKIRQIILNVFDNAIKYTNSGKVIVHLEKSGYNYRIKIQDTGIGLTKEELSEIFKSFVRGIGARKMVGSGLGLHIAKKLIKMHRGEIWAESQGKGKGSTFYIDLPIKQ